MTYTEEQVQQLLKEQREICGDAYLVAEGKAELPAILKAPSPSLPPSDEGKEIDYWENRALTDDKEIEELRQWKKEAIAVMPDFQEIGKILGLRLGTSVSNQLIRKIKELQVELTALKAEIHNNDLVTINLLDWISTEEFEPMTHDRDKNIKWAKDENYYTSEQLFMKYYDENEPGAIKASPSPDVASKEVREEGGDQ